eukprot:6072478-Lingulodinium_polyedra.AAC.1
MKTLWSTHVLGSKQISKENLKNLRQECITNVNDGEKTNFEGELEKPSPTHECAGEKKFEEESEDSDAESVGAKAWWDDV